jgi:murein L,D-transpeptidase YcbB/YkuD
MKRLVAMTAIMISVLGYAQDTEQVSTQMNDEVKEIASVANKWHNAWQSNDKKAFLELMRPEKPELAENLLKQSAQLFAYLEDTPHRCLIVSRTEQRPAYAEVRSYPRSPKAGPGRKLSFVTVMTKQDDKWYVQRARSIDVNKIATHYRQWSEEYQKYEIWYDKNAPDWLRPGQKESELAKKIAALEARYRTQYKDRYGHLLADIRKELLEGNRLQRSQLLEVIQQKQLWILFDESFVGPLRACLKSEDYGVVQLARDLYVPLKKEVRRKLETDASKIPHSAEEFKALSEEYSRKVSKLDKALAGYRSKQIYRDFLEVLEKEVLPLYDKGRTAGRQMHKMYERDPNAFKKSAFDEKESSPAIIDICAAVLKGTYEQFGKAVKEGSMRLPDDEQNKIFYWSSLA